MVKNWEEVIAGELPKDELALAVALMHSTFQITTQKPFPPLPGMMSLWPLQKKALEEHGQFYNNDLGYPRFLRPLLPSWKPLNQARRLC